MITEELKGRDPLTESLWRRAERDQVRRERVRRIHNGTIIPAHRGLPNVMAKDSSGKWWPNANFVNGGNNGRS